MSLLLFDLSPAYHAVVASGIRGVKSCLCHILDLSCEAIAVCVSV